ncbi:MAG TPA: GNAT family N-acetyltransferase [Candidatus Sulfotelmatobacter sp.]|nr:GNAT family N-acetyltransferase [Candidatus Sulfotelmatobacter sp.]HWI63320.1 GNAT family N-acetyltransferase [Symbiobacteriaceae bacterium]
MSDLRMVQLRDAAHADYEGMLSVARSLPEWFNEQGLLEMSRDFETDQAIVAVFDEAVVGFVTWRPPSGGREGNLAELTWLGVAPKFQGLGVGRQLVDALVDRCRQTGVSVLEVATLADSVDYAPYVGTRAFYRRLGFRDWRVDAGFYGPDADRLLLRLSL